MNVDANDFDRAKRARQRLSHKWQKLQWTKAFGEQSTDKTSDSDADSSEPLPGPLNIPIVLAEDNDRYL